MEREALNLEQMVNTAPIIQMRSILNLNWVVIPRGLFC